MATQIHPVFMQAKIELFSLRNCKISHQFSFDSKPRYITHECKPALHQSLISTSFKRLLTYYLPKIDFPFENCSLPKVLVR